MINFFLGVAIFLVALIIYFIGRHRMGKAGEDFFIGVIKEFKEPGDEKLREMLWSVLKHYKEWNHLRRFL